MKRLLAAGMVAILAAANASVALCADVIGTVSDLKGDPAAKLQVSARDSSGKSAGVALTDGAGRYLIGGLAPGTYTFVLDPLSSGFKGGDAVAALNDNGLVVDWKVSADAAALALAHEGSDQTLAGDPFGYSEGEFAALVAAATGLIAGGVVGGIAAAGGFSGSPSSPSE